MRSKDVSRHEEVTDTTVLASFVITRVDRHLKMLTKQIGHSILTTQASEPAPLESIFPSVERPTAVHPFGVVVSAGD